MNSIPYLQQLKRAAPALLVAALSASAAGGYGQLPLFFVPDSHQAGGDAGYYLRQGRVGVRFTPERVRFEIGGEQLSVRFHGARPAPALEARHRLAGTVNFLSGSGPERWRTNVPTYRSIVYRDLYPGIDLVYQAVGEDLESQFEVSPGAAAGVIRWRYQGARSVKLDPDGSLRVATAKGELREHRPVLYQWRDGDRISVRGSFRVFDDGSVGFRIGDYDRGSMLVIDPILSFSTYLGGSGLDAARAVAADSSGSVYVAGYTDSTDFPVASALQPARKGGADAFVAKLNPAGTALVYCTYLGGSADDRAFGIAVSSAGEATVTGWTYSTDFPTTTGARQRSLAGGRDGFVARLSAQGSALVYGAYLGGSGFDSGNAVAIDGLGNAYIAGDTHSTNFPVLSGYRSSSGGRRDAFAAKLNATGTSLVWSTYLGGSGDDLAAAVALGPSNEVYLAGSTNSTNFPAYLALQGASSGGQDAFVTKLSSDGKSLGFSTYLGGSGGTVGASEGATAIAVDAAGAAYIGGYTSSTNFPAASAYQSTYRGGTTDGFLSKFTASGALVFSTYFGGSGADYVNGLALGANGAVTLAGYTSSTNLPVTAAHQSTKSGGNDAFVARFSAGGGSVDLVSYLGGNDGDAANAVAADTSGSLWIAGQTLSTSFPARNAIQASNPGGYSGFVAKIANSVPAAVFRTIYGNTMATVFGSASLYDGLGHITSAPGVSQSISGDTFAVGRNNTGCVYMNVFKGDTRTWAGGWMLVGCSKDGDPAVAAALNGEAYVVARDASYGYYLNRYTPGS
ncbi:MAG TPA: SBBP repeat-containing protein, partial [Bryobacteraceae bacterium]|nr:SBBP repeat-containing protein [Bryobacteraceae bacterium]